MKISVSIVICSLIISIFFDSISGTVEGDDENGPHSVLARIKRDRYVIKQKVKNSHVSTMSAIIGSGGGGSGGSSGGGEATTSGSAQTSAPTMASTSSSAQTTVPPAPGRR